MFLNKTSNTLSINAPTKSCICRNHVPNSSILKSKEKDNLIFPEF